ncbi:MAG: hypothetical protein IPK83_15025 [Planctomycetes bacterium]|nr:hypothetical protein [Planctomycetota bacterium]
MRESLARAEDLTPDTNQVSVRHLSRPVILAALFGLVLCTGCTEFNHFGQISDRQGTFPVNDVTISQQQNDGTWKRIGNTDGHGKWNILKSKIAGGGRVKLSKPGYHTLNMSESEFLQQSNVLLESSHEAYEGDSTDSAWDTRQ